MRGPNSIGYALPNNKSGLGLWGFDRLTVDTDIEIGGDVTLSRSAANQLKTSGSMWITDYLNIGTVNGSLLSTLTVGGLAGTAGFEVNIGSGVVLQAYNRNIFDYASFAFDASVISFRPNGSTAMTIDAGGITVGITAAKKVGLWGATPVVQNSGWNVTSGYTPDKGFDPEAMTVTELARVVGTLIDTLKTYGMLGA